MNAKDTRALMDIRTPSGAGSPKRAVGYRPLAAAPNPAVIHAAVIPIGRLPGGRVAVFTQGE